MDVTRDELVTHAELDLRLRELEARIRVDMEEEFDQIQQWVIATVIVVALGLLLVVLLIHAVT